MSRNEKTIAYGAAVGIPLFIIMLALTTWLAIN